SDRLRSHFARGPLQGRDPKEKIQIRSPGKLRRTAEAAMSRIEPFIKILESFLECLPAHDRERPLFSRLAIGLPTPLDMRAKGLDHALALGHQFLALIRPAFCDRLQDRRKTG